MKNTAYISEDGYDLCVICGKKTQYPTETHIDYRIGYIEGVGQTCDRPFSSDCPQVSKDKV